MLFIYDKSYHYHDEWVLMSKVLVSKLIIGMFRNLENFGYLPLPTSVGGDTKKPMVPSI